MATPIAHGLVAVLSGRLLAPQSTRLRLWLAFAIFAAVAPDLDFLLGLMVGDVNRFHHGASHSIGAALIFGSGIGLGAAAMSLPPMRIGLAAAALYVSHLALDLLTIDTRMPYGQPLLWPLSNEHFAMSTPPLLGIRHASADGSFRAFGADVFSKHNLAALVREIVLLVPPLAVAWFAWRRLTMANRPSPGSAARRLVGIDRNSSAQDHD